MTLSTPPMKLSDCCICRRWLSFRQPPLRDVADLLAAPGGLQKRNGFHSDNAELLMNVDGRSPLAEAYRHLRTSVLLSTAGRAPKIVANHLQLAGRREDDHCGEHGGQFGSDGRQRCHHRRRHAPAASPFNLRTLRARRAEFNIFRAT